MTRAFVVDASVALGWVHPGQAAPQTARMLDAIEGGARIEAPSLWPVEVANALTVLARRGKLTSGDRAGALGWLRALPVRLDYEMGGLAFSALASLAVEHQLSMYDAAYLELAQRRRLPLGCKDGPLHKAARRCGVRVVE